MTRHRFHVHAILGAHAEHHDFCHWSDVQAWLDAAVRPWTPTWNEVAPGGPGGAIAILEPTGEAHDRFGLLRARLRYASGVWFRDVNLADFPLWGVAEVHEAVRFGTRTAEVRRRHARVMDAANRPTHHGLTLRIAS